MDQSDGKAKPLQSQPGLAAAQEEQELTTEQLMKLALDKPLYSPIELGWHSANRQLRSLRLNAVRRDMYCPKCRQSATFTPIVPEEVTARDNRERATLPISSSHRGSAPVTHWTDDFTLQLTCARRGHPVRLHFAVEIPPDVRKALEPGGTPSPFRLVKVGQWPSMSDFQLGDLSRFDEGMSKAQKQEFVRAIHSAAHGFSVAACVYFRRVFESVLTEARDRHMHEHQMATWPAYEGARTDDRIRLLRGYLPEFMVQHPQLYAILSLGVHELTEEQCAEEVPMLRDAIELIMEDRVSEARRQKQREQLSKLIAQRTDRHMNKPPGDTDPA